MNIPFRFSLRKRISIWLLSLCGVYFLIGISINSSAQFTQVVENFVFKKHIINYNVTFKKHSGHVKILLWTEFFGSMDWLEGIRKEFQNCNCSVTSDKSEIEAVDAVVFHLMDLWMYKGLPKYRAADQVWILFIAEPPPHVFSLGLHVPNMMFNWTMSYRHDSTIRVSYGKLIELTEKEKSRQKQGQSVFKNKPKFIASVIGNCFDDARRYWEISELKKYVFIDEYGRCGNLICPRTHACVNMMNGYKFKIAFDNSHCRDYVSEKFWTALLERHIPVVNWKRNQVASAPPNSYINIYDFNSIREAAKYLITVSTNSSLYESYFDWKKHYKVYGPRLWESFPPICEKLSSKTGYQAQTLIDPWKWIKDDTCEMWSISNMIKRRWDRFMYDFKIL